MVRKTYVNKQREWGERKRAYGRQLSQKTTSLRAPLGSGVQKICTEILH